MKTFLSRFVAVLIVVAGLSLFAGCKGESATTAATKDPLYTQILFENNQMIPEIVDAVAGTYVNPLDKKEYITFRKDGNYEYHGRLFYYLKKGQPLTETYFIEEGSWSTDASASTPEGQRQMLGEGILQIVVSSAHSNFSPSGILMPAFKWDHNRILRGDSAQNFWPKQ